MISSPRILFALTLVAALSAAPAFAQVNDPVRIGALSLSYVARNSKTAQAAIAQVEAFERTKAGELERKAAQLQKQQAELQQAVSMSPRAVADLQRAFDKARIEFDRFQQDAQAEIETMQMKFDSELRIKLAPIVDEISKEKGLHLVFGLEQAPMIIWRSPAVDISDEVVKRLDAPK